MKRFTLWVGLGLGLAVGSGVVYAFSISEAMRLVTVAVGAFLLAALTIGGTALVVNRQWTKALGTYSPRIIHQHRYPSYGSSQPTTVEGASFFQSPELLPPSLPPLDDQADPSRDLDDEVVA
jgi:hypothetical protein